MILNGEQRPGSKLLQLDLAKRFGVAQAVVREALFELQAFGLVETIDNRGVYVSELDTELLIDAIGVREVHEGLAARLCCERITKVQLRELAELAEQIYCEALRGEFDESGRLDRAFHQRIVHISSSRIIARLTDHYWILGKFLRLDRDPQEVREEHLIILKAIEENRPATAERLMREHIAVGRQMIEEKVRNGSFVPHWVAKS